MVKEIIIDSPGIKMQRLCREHIDGILALMNAEGWYYYDHRELARYLSLGQDAFALMARGKVIGSIFTTNYGNQAWIGNIVIAEDARGKGLATRMIHGVVDLLREHRRVHTFRLGSVPLAIGLYKKIGFRAEAFTTAQEAVLPLVIGAKKIDPPGTATVERLDARDLDAAARLDQRFFRSARLPLLTALYEDSVRAGCLTLKERGALVGFIMARRRRASKKEGCFAEGPDYAYRLGPCCVSPEYGIDGFKALFQEAVAALNDEVHRSGGEARMYAVFPRNAGKAEIFRDTRALAADMGMDTNMDLDGVFDQHDHIFGAPPSTKNEAQWRYMANLGFRQEYFEQVMCFVPGASRSTAATTQADPEGIFASATPGDKA